MLLLSLQHKVDAPAVGIVNSEELVVLRVVPLALRWERMRFTHCTVKRTADREHRIANLFGAQSSPIKAPEKIVISVNGRVVRIISSSKLIGMREHYHPVHSFYRPAALDELLCQVIEQLRIRRSLTARAEVVRRRDDTFAEMILPDTVDHHTGSQGVVRIGDPVG